ncbi:MAG: alpha/beta hydrolase [Polyangiaceae bacterium]|nr:alpha/beta hydrolase [Polyangiaceae bacterium]
MTTFVLIPGAGGAAWYWNRVVPLLERAGHEAIAVDLPGDDPDAGLAAYGDAVVGAIGARKDVVLVAQSLGGFTAPLVCARASVKSLVFVNAMIPLPGETAGAWWDATGAPAARRSAAEEHGYTVDFDIETYFLHDVPKDVAEEGASQVRPEADIVFGEPNRFDAWPNVPTFVVVGKDDRFFPAAFQAKVARDRLGKDVREIAGGHLVALSNPEGLTDLLIELSGSGRG